MKLGQTWLLDWIGFDEYLENAHQACDKRFEPK